MANTDTRMVSKEAPLPRIWPCALLLTLIALIAPASAVAAKSDDRNRNQIPDKWEKAHRMPTSPNQARKDIDEDGLDALAEYQSKTNPRKEDTDGDGLIDSEEDRDRDKVDNGNEVRERTRPDKKDTNGNGRPDGKEDADRDGLNNAGEDASGNDPIKRDSDGDGIKDGDENAGHVASFQADLLTIRTFGGKTVRGWISSETEFYCDTTYGFEEGPDEDEGDDDADAARANSRDDVDPLPEGVTDAEDCGPESLKPGTVLHEALIEQGPSGPEFRGVDLVVDE